MTVKVKTFIIKATNDGFYLNENNRIERGNCNIDKRLIFSSEKPIFWSGVITHLSESGVAYVKITELHSSYSQYHKTQKLSREISFLHLNFDNFISNELGSLFSNFNWDIFSSSLKQKPIIPPKTFYKQTHNELTNFSDNNIYHDILPIKFDFSVKIDSSKITFHTHLIRAKIKLNSLYNETIIDIPNEFIKQEFEYIKSYFIKKLGKTIDVTGSAQKKHNQIEILSINSDWVKNINTSVIESVRQSQTLNLLKKPKTTSNSKALYIDEEIHDQIGEINIFKLDQKDLIETIIQNSSIRNKEQINYLAKQLHDRNEKIRFTLAPKFGFLFFIEKKDRLHYCLELLNSHATYVWSFPTKYKGEDTIDIIEKEVLTIKEIGRQKYRANLNSRNNKEFQFKIIMHSKKESNSNSIKIWATRLKTIVN